MTQDSKNVTKHISVLLKEAIEGLAIQDGEIVVDGTFGGGGHSAYIHSHYPNIKQLVCVDLDEEAKARYESMFANDSHVNFVESNFKDVEHILVQSKLSNVDKVLLDLGTSTMQLLDDKRGFSFNSDTPLKMTFSSLGSHTGFSAYDIVNSWQESSIADILYFYGQERSARKIAKAIVNARNSSPIKTSKDLARIIEGVITRSGKTHPATKTFQALRIAVNDELKVLSEALTAWWQALNEAGRIAVITFHSLEDRIVKKWMKGVNNGRVITKKPITPSRSELKDNPRSRSAKLRIIEKVL